MKEKKLVKVATIIISMMFVVGCQKSVKKTYINESIIDYVIADNTQKNPYIKEIVVGGREHSDEELEGFVKVRSSNGSLRYRASGIFGWWSSIDEDKTYKMNELERIIEALRIKDRDDFIRMYKDKKYLEKINKEVVSEIKESFDMISSNLNIKDNIDYLLYSDILSESKISREVQSKACRKSIVVGSRFIDELEIIPHLLSIASENDNQGEYIGFSEEKAHMNVLRVINNYKGAVKNHYIGQKFEIKNQCIQNLELRIGRNAILNIGIQSKPKKKLIKLSEIDYNNFGLEVGIDSVNFVGGLINMDEMMIQDLSVSIDRGVVGIINRSSRDILITGINVMFNGKEIKNKYLDYILPENKRMFSVANKEANRIFTVNKYKGGDITGYLEIGYVDEGMNKIIMVDLDAKEIAVWNSMILNRDF